MTYSIGFAVASAIAGISVLALLGRVAWAFAIGLPITILLAIATATLWTMASSVLPVGPVYATKYLYGCLIVGASAGAVLGLAVSFIVAPLAFLAAQRKIWTVVVLFVLIVGVATHWPLGHLVDYATTLGFELGTPTHWSDQSVWYSNDSIRGGGAGAGLGAVAGAVIAAVASGRRKQPVAPLG